MSKPKETTLKQIQEGAKRASKQFETWPDWKKEISEPSIFVPCREVVLSHEYTTAEIYDENKGSIFSMAEEIPLTREDIIKIAKAMNISSQELSENQNESSRPKIGFDKYFEKRKLSGLQTQVLLDQCTANKL